MLPLKTKKKFVSIFCLWLTLLLLGCVSNQQNPFNQTVQIIQSGKCYDAETFARKQLEGAELYLLLGFNETQCNYNRKKGIEYFTISAKLGNTIANDALRELGVKVQETIIPPAPPVKMDIRPPVQPIQIQPSQIQNNRSSGFLTCTKRGGGVIECVGPKGVMHCIDVGAGGLQCSR